MLKTIITLLIIILPSNQKCFAMDCQEKDPSTLNKCFVENLSTEDNSLANSPQTLYSESSNVHNEGSNISFKPEKTKKKLSLIIPNIETSEKSENSPENLFTTVDITKYKLGKIREISKTIKINSLNELGQIVHLTKEQNKILVIDIDDTILNFSGLIDPKTPQVLYDLSQHVRIIFATARKSDPASRKYTYLALLNLGIDTKKLKENYKKSYLPFCDVVSKNIEDKDIELYNNITQMENGILFTGIPGSKGSELLKLLAKYGINPEELENLYFIFVDDSPLEIISYKRHLQEYIIKGQAIKFIN